MKFCQLLDMMAAVTVDAVKALTFHNSRGKLSVSKARGGGRRAIL